MVEHRQDKGWRRENATLGGEKEKEKEKEREREKDKQYVNLHHERTKNKEQNNVKCTQSECKKKIIVLHLQVPITSHHQNHQLS